MYFYWLHAMDFLFALFFRPLFLLRASIKWRKFRAFTQPRNSFGIKVSFAPLFSEPFSLLLPCEFRKRIPLINKAIKTVFFLSSTLDFPIHEFVDRPSITLFRPGEKRVPVSKLISIMAWWPLMGENRELWRMNFRQKQTFDRSQLSEKIYSAVFAYIDEMRKW